MRKLWLPRYAENRITSIKVNMAKVPLRRFWMPWHVSMPKGVLYGSPCICNLITGIMLLLLTGRAGTPPMGHVGTERTYSEEDYAFLPIIR